MVARSLLKCLLAVGVVTAVFAFSSAGPALGQEILVGEYGSMTGSEATFGQMTHNGIMLAVEEINAKGGVNGQTIRVINYDDQGKAQEAGTAVTRLIAQDKVVAVLGEVASSLSLAGGRVAQQYGVPMISPSSTNPKVTEIGDMVFRVCFLDEFQGYAMAKFARDHLKVKKVAVLYDQRQAYSTGLKDFFKKAFVEMQGEVVAEAAYSGGDQSFNAQLAQIRDAKPQAIFIPGYYTDVGNIALQARKLGVRVPLLGGDGWDSAKLGEIAGSAVDDCYYTNHYSHEEKRPEVQEYVQKFKSKYGMVPDGLSALGYDAAKLLADAMERAPSLDGKDLAKAIAETKDFHGVTGVFSIDANRNAKKPATIIKMKGGKPKFVTMIQPPN